MSKICINLLKKITIHVNQNERLWNSLLQLNNQSKKSWKKNIKQRYKNIQHTIYVHLQLQVEKTSYNHWLQSAKILLLPSIRNNYVAIQSFPFSNIAKAILDFSLLLLVKISLLHPFWYQFFASFLMALSLKLLLFQLSQFMQRD